MALTFDFDVNPESNLSQTLGTSNARWKLNGYIPELIQITVNATASTTVTIQNSGITTNHVVINQYAQIPSDITYVTSNGSIALACPNGFPNLVLYLGVKAV